MPDGRIGRFEVPEGTTPENAQSLIEQHLSGQTQQPQEQGFSQRVGQAFDERAAMEQRIAEQAVAGQKTTPEALGEIALSSTGGKVGDVIGAAVQPAMQAIAPYVPQGVKDVAGFVGEQYQKIPERGRDVISAVGNLANLVPTGAVGKAAVTAAPTVAKVGVKGAEIASDVGKIATVATKKQAVSTVAPVIPKETAVLADRAKDFGIELRVDQISPTRARKSLQKISQDIPYSGVDVSEQVQKQQFHRALAKEIGQNADNLSPEVIGKFLSDSSSKFNSAIGTGDFKVTSSDMGKISNIESALPKTVTKDIADIVRTHTKQFKQDLTPRTGQKTVSAGVDEFGRPLEKTVSTKLEPIINAQKLASLRSELVTSLPNIDSKARGHVSKIINVIDDIAERNISPEAASKLKEVRTEWRNFKTMEPLLEKSTDGFINPTELMNRVASSKYIKASRLKVGEDNFVDLARFGKKFLVRSEGSDTVSKGLLAGGIGSLLPTAMIASPAAAAGSAALQAGLIGANRGFQAINKSQAIVEASIKKSLKQKKSNPLSNLLPKDKK